MKILVIASILPVPGIISENHYVINYIKRHIQRNPDMNFILARPTAYLPLSMGSITHKKQFWKDRRLVAGMGKYKLYDLPVEILPYFSVGSISSLHRRFSGSVLLNFRKIKSLARLLPDVVQANNLYPDGLLALYLKRKYQIPYSLVIQDERRYVSGNVISGKTKEILERADVLVTLSMQMNEILREAGYLNSKVLPIGIHESFNVGCPKKARGRKIKFVTASNLVPIKNMISVIEAIGLIKSERESIAYTIIGDGPDKSMLEQRVKELELENVITFAGAIENNVLARELVKHDVYIQPSFKETFGLSYFEALSCGLPVILTRNTGAYHLIKKFNCFIAVDPYEPVEIANAMIRFTSDALLSEMRSEAFAAGKIASWENYIEYFDDYYRSKNRT